MYWNKINFYCSERVKIVLETKQNSYFTICLLKESAQVTLMPLVYILNGQI